MRTAIAILFLLLIAACARETAPPTVPTQEPEYSASITYSGEFVPAELSRTTMTAQDGKVTIATYDSTGAVGRIQERQVSREAWSEFESIVDDIDTFDPQYGQTLRGTVADAGIAEIVVMRAGETVRTTIDPNVDEAYPPKLLELREWFSEQSAPQTTTDETLAVACTTPRPESCVQVYDPVCGDDGKTYSNSCAACAGTVNSYTVGEC